MGAFPTITDNIPFQAREKKEIAMTDELQRKIDRAIKLIQSAGADGSVVEVAYLKANMTTLEDILFVGLPECVTILPEDWEGNTKRSLIKFRVSNQAIENCEFDLRGFVKSKFNNALKAIQKRENIEKLCMTHHLSMIVDQVSNKVSTIFYIHIEYAI